MAIRRLQLVVLLKLYNGIIKRNNKENGSTCPHATKDNDKTCQLTGAPIKNRRGDILNTPRESLMVK